MWDVIGTVTFLGGAEHLGVREASFRQKRRMRNAKRRHHTPRRASRSSRQTHETSTYDETKEQARPLTSSSLFWIPYRPLHSLKELSASVPFITLQHSKVVEATAITNALSSFHFGQHNSCKKEEPQLETENTSTRDIYIYGNPISRSACIYNLRKGG